jgi:hypothetical protein
MSLDLIGHRLLFLLPGLATWLLWLGLYVRNRKNRERLLFLLPWANATWAVLVAGWSLLVVVGSESRTADLLLINSIGAQQIAGWLQSSKKNDNGTLTQLNLRT